MSCESNTFHVYGLYHEDKLLYVGSCADRVYRADNNSYRNGMKHRFVNHKSDCFRTGRQCHKRMRAYLQEHSITVDTFADNIVMKPIETVEGTLEDARNAEGQQIRALNPLCNLRIEDRSRAEWCKDNAELIREKKRQYYIDNLDETKRRAYEAYREHMADPAWCEREKERCRLKSKAEYHKHKQDPELHKRMKEINAIATTKYYRKHAQDEEWRDTKNRRLREWRRLNKEIKRLASIDI